MLRPKDVCAHLGVSTATLRRWSDTFAEQLSPSAARSVNAKGGSTQRRYTDQDVVVLTQAKQLLAEGKTYEEASLALQDSSGTTDSAIAIQMITEPLVSDSASVVAIYETALASKDQTITALQQTVAIQEQLVASLREQLTSQASMPNTPPTLLTWWMRIDKFFGGRMLGVKEKSAGQTP